MVSGLGMCGLDAVVSNTFRCVLLIVGCVEKWGFVLPMNADETKRTSIKYRIKCFVILFFIV